MVAGRPSVYKIPKTSWHRFCINTSKIDGYDEFDNKDWNNYRKIGNFVFKSLKIRDIITYCLVIGNGKRSCGKEAHDLFRMNFKTTPTTSDYKKVFIWTNSAIWIQQEKIIPWIHSCSVHGCKNFTQQLEKILNERD